MNRKLKILSLILTFVLVISCFESITTFAASGVLISTETGGSIGEPSQHQPYDWRGPRTRMRWKTSGNGYDNLGLFTYPGTTELKAKGYPSKYLHNEFTTDTAVYAWAYIQCEEWEGSGGNTEKFINESWAHLLRFRVYLDWLVSSDDDGNPWTDTTHPNGNGQLTNPLLIAFLTGDGANNTYGGRRLDPTIILNYYYNDTYKWYSNSKTGTNGTKVDVVYVDTEMMTPEKTWGGPDNKKEKGTYDVPGTTTTKYVLTKFKDQTTTYFTSASIGNDSAQANYTSGKTSYNFSGQFTTSSSKTYTAEYYPVSYTSATNRYKYEYQVQYNGTTPTGKYRYINTSGGWTETTTKPTQNSPNIKITYDSQVKAASYAWGTTKKTETIKFDYTVNGTELKQTWYTPYDLNKNGLASDADVKADFPSYVNSGIALNAEIDNGQGTTDGSAIKALDNNAPVSFKFKLLTKFGFPANLDPSENITAPNSGSLTFNTKANGATLKTTINGGTPKTENFNTYQTDTFYYGTPNIRFTMPEFTSLEVNGQEYLNGNGLAALNDLGNGILKFRSIKKGNYAITGDKGNWMYVQYNAGYYSKSGLKYSGTFTVNQNNTGSWSATKSAASLSSAKLTNIFCTQPLLKGNFTVETISGVN